MTVSKTRGEDLSDDDFATIMAAMELTNPRYELGEGLLTVLIPRTIPDGLPLRRRPMENPGIGWIAALIIGGIAGWLAG